MDATRPRRTRDDVRLQWYRRCRCWRFARHLHFAPAAIREPYSLGHSRAELSLPVAPRESWWPRQEGQDPFPISQCPEML